MLMREDSDGPVAVDLVGQVGDGQVVLVVEGGESGVLGQYACDVGVDGIGVLSTQRCRRVRNSHHVNVGDHRKQSHRIVS